MPSKRRRLLNRQIGIPASAIEAWKIGDLHGLNRALGIRPWQVSPFDADRVTPDDATWPRAAELRAALIAAAGPPGRSDRHGQPLGAARPRI